MLSFFRKMKADACIFVCFDLNLIGQTRLASKKLFKDKRNNFSLMLCLKHTKISKKHHYYIYISGIIKGRIIMHLLHGCAVMVLPPLSCKIFQSTGPNEV